MGGMTMTTGDGLSAWNGDRERYPKDVPG